MSTKELSNLAAIEIDMRDLLLRAKDNKSLLEANSAVDDFSGLVRQISGRSVRDINHLVDGLQRLREKLHDDGARLANEISNYAQFSDLVVQLTKIASDSMTHV
jgi:hypothetical protein